MAFLRSRNSLFLVGSIVPFSLACAQPVEPQGAAVIPVAADSTASAPGATAPSAGIITPQDPSSSSGVLPEEPPTEETPPPPASASDGIKNGDETDVDCGGTSGAKCADAQGCAVAADCTSGVCKANACAAPSNGDGVKNGDETDVDCGGTSGIKCAASKTCKAHTDCALDACMAGKCALGRSCRQRFGGATCGAGEVGSQGANHEDCCTAPVVPRPAAAGGAFKLDKYLITAGRMRAFIEATGGNVRAWAQANPKLLPPEWKTEWEASVPANEVDLVQLLGSGQGKNAYWGKEGQANGCYVAGKGAPTYWHPKDKLEAYAGDMERAFTQDELDQKTMNCAPRAMFVAFCAWDGGRLPTIEEWRYAVRGGKTEAEQLFPWGNPGADPQEEIKARASYNKNYAFPLVGRAGTKVDDKGLPWDRAFEVAAPGRFPLGAGPYGHQDLLGLTETFLTGTGNNTGVGGVRQYAFQEGFYGVVKYGTLHLWDRHTSHYAISARCARTAQ
jgi:formylglycine-generating enzyme required for sulfatase activity